MKKILLLAACCLLFSACGGGGGSSGSGTTPTTPESTVPKEISGTASQGAALTGKAYLKDAKGAEINADIGTNGTFKFVVDNMTAPYMLKAGTIYSFAPAHGTANINPFTDLAAKIASNVTDLSTVYSNSTGTIGSQLLAIQTKIQSTVDDLNSKISQVYQKYGMTTSDQKNFMTGTVTIGQGVDALFDTFKITVASDGSITMKTISDGAIIFTAKSSGSGTMTIVSENFSANLPSSLAGSTVPASTNTGSITVKW
jgi:glucoamylase